MANRFMVLLVVLTRAALVLQIGSELAIAMSSRVTGRGLSVRIVWQKVVFASGLEWRLVAPRAMQLDWNQLPCAL